MNNEKLWDEYLRGKQTYAQLALTYNCSVKTIQRRIDDVKVSLKPVNGCEVVVLMDTTYFGRTFAVMLFKDALTGKNLYWQYIKYETNQLYAQGITHLQNTGFTIKGIVCDGRKGLLKLFGDIPVQMCQFHQIAIVTRYLTRKPKTEAAKELRALTLKLTQTDKESFEGALMDWHQKWGNYLNERTTDQVTKKSRYTHRRLRSAWRSLYTNLPWLFVWYDNIELSIPNTTNMIDGHFADLKNKLRNHNGLSMKRKTKFMDGFLRCNGQ